MWLGRLVTRGVMVAVFALAGCGKKDEGDKPKGGDKAEKSGGDKPAPKDAAPSVPSKDDVAKLDCDAVCATKADCDARFVKTPLDEMKKVCKDGCDMMKSVYDPAKHGTTAAVLAKYAGGKCPD